MAKEIKQPKVKLRDGEKFLHSVSVSTANPIVMKEGGKLFVTNQRIFTEIFFGSGEVICSIDLSNIGEVKVARFFNLIMGMAFGIPYIIWPKCIHILDNDGILLKKIRPPPICVDISVVGL